MERIQKLLAQAGVASRRQSEILIKEGKVTINNKVAQLGDKASFSDQIKVNNTLVTMPENKVYYVINKPPSVITSLKDPQKRAIITDFIAEKRRIFPVGRLDYDTTGTLLLTNDGELAFRLTHPSYEIERVYQARLTRSLTKSELLFLNGPNVVINNQKSAQKVTHLNHKSYQVSLHIGTYHHVKKLFELANVKVLNLKRIAFAGITCKNLPTGSSRKLNIKEIRELKKQVKLL